MSFEKDLSIYLSKDNLKNVLFGPPYTTGKIHQGTAAATIVKDFYLRYLDIIGNRTTDSFFYALDTQGLPIELKVEKEYLAAGKLKNQVEPSEWLKRCLNYSDKNVEPLKDQFSNLKLTKDVYNTRWVQTNEIDFKVKQMNFFADLLKEKKVYQSTRFIDYCLRCDTSLANAETEPIELKEKTAYLYAIELKKEIKPGIRANLILATTMPHTLVNNQAIMIAEKDYYLFKEKNGPKYYILGHKLGPELLLNDLQLVYVEDLKSSFLSDNQYVIKDSLKRIVVSDGVKYDIPEEPKPEDALLLIACVHLSPWDSSKDFEVCVNNNITDVHQIYQSCDQAIVKKRTLKVPPEFHFLGTKKIRDSKKNYESHICWRCKQLVEETLTKQWYIKIDENLRSLLITHVENLKTNNEGYKNKFVKWCSAKSVDWCISRSRTYGTPLPYVFCKNTSCLEFENYKPLYLETKDISSREQLYPSMLHKVIQRKNLRCSECEQILHNQDFCLDVWADPAFLPHYFDSKPSYEFLMEGQDQNRGFFYVVAILSLLKLNKVLYDGLIYTPWFITSQKKKISKSEGGGDSFDDLLSEIGVLNFRSYCISKCDGYPTIFDKQLAKLEKKYVNNILNISRFLKLEEYKDLTVKDWPYYEDHFSKEPLISEIIAETKKIRLKLHKDVVNGHFDKYWITLREFILQRYSRILINTYKKQARTDSNIAELIKGIGTLVLDLCIPVLSTLNE